MKEIKERWKDEMHLSFSPSVPKCICGHGEKITVEWAEDNLDSMPFLYCSTSTRAME